MKRPLITLLTDFGTADHYVAAMKGVILSACPEAQLVDITHEVGAFAIGEAAWLLAQAAPCFPPETVHLAVVDPGVGSARRPLVAEAAGHRFVAPDNGVLTLVLEGGGSVHEIAEAPWFRQPVSRTFHGRDIFAPAAARLADGIPPADFGPPVGDWVAVNLRPRVLPSGQWEGVVLRVDHFGNIITNLPAELMEDIGTGKFELRLGSCVVRNRTVAYAEMLPDNPFAIAGSAGNIEVSVNRGSAAAMLGAVPGAAVILGAGTAWYRY